MSNLLDRENKIKWIEGMLAALDTSNLDAWDEAQLLNAVGGLLRAAAVVGVDNSKLKEYLDRETENIPLTENALENYMFGNACYMAGRSDKAVEIAKQTKSQPRNDKGVFLDENGELCLCNAYSALSFYMNYETKNGGKENYNDIISQFNNMHAEKFAQTAEKIQAGDIDAYAAMVYYAAGLIDTMEVMDQALYEIFAKLRMYYKEAVNVLTKADINSVDYELILAYAIFKGCRMKVIQTEKYDAIAFEIYERALKYISEGKDCGTVSALILALSEYIKNRNYQDYGIGRGGVLWN